MLSRTRSCQLHVSPKIKFTFSREFSLHGFVTCLVKCQISQEKEKEQLDCFVNTNFICSITLAH